MYSLDQRITLVVGFILITYFLWMDIILYYNIQHKPPGYEDLSQKAPHLYTPFSDMTMKLIMCDPPNHYIWTPLAQFIVDYLKFTVIFPGISANMITFVHFTIALIAATKFISSDRLYMRRIGVMLFELRTFLDALDGVVARERKNKRYIMESEHGTWGYVWDGLADILGSLALMIAVYVYIRKRYLNTTQADDTGYQLLESGGVGKVPYSVGMPNSNSSTSFVVVTNRAICSKLFNIAIMMCISLTFWDRYITKYHFYLENQYATPKQQILANEVLKSSSMWIIIWFWRLCNAHAFLEISMVAIYIDKIWEFLCWIQFVGYIVVNFLVIATEIHLHDTIKYIGPILHSS